MLRRQYVTKPHVETVLFPQLFPHEAWQHTTWQRSRFCTVDKYFLL